MKKRKLAVLASCMLICSSFASVVKAEETGAAKDTELEEVVVTDTKINSLKNPVKMTVITEAEIKAKGAKTVAEALKDVAGLYVNNSLVKGKSAGQIRGSDSSSTKVIIDGVMLDGGGDGRQDLSVIPTDNIEKIEIFKGPVPVIYGSNAPGGVIFITTKNASGKSSGALTVAGGSWGTELYSLSLSGNAGKVNYYFNAKQSDTDGYNDNPRGIRDSAGHIYKSNTAEDAKYFNGKLKWDINAKSSLTVFGSYSDSTKELPNRYGYYNGKYTLLPYPGSGGTLTARNSFYGGGNAFTANMNTTYNWADEPIRESYIGAVYDLKLNDDNDINLKFYRSTLKSLLTCDPVPVLANPKLYGWQTINWDGSINGYELQHTIKTSKVNTATWGYSYETRSFVELTPFDSNGDGIPDGPDNRGDYDYTGKSFYMQNVTNLSSKLSTALGYRHNSIDDGIIVTTRAFSPSYQNIRGIYTSDNPVFSMNYNLSNSTAVHAAIGTSFRSPNAMERSAPYYPLAPKGVLPEEGINREVGLSATKYGLNFDVTAYGRDITNMIKGGGSGGGHSQYWNIPHVDMHGYEAEVSKKFTQRLKGFWNYSYTNAYDTTMHMQVSDIPYRKYSYGINYAGKGGITTNLAVNYVGAVRSMYSEGNGNGNSDGNSTVSGNPYGYWGTRNLPGYHVVDLKISKVNDNKEYYIKVLNLFNEDYFTGAYVVAPGRYVEVGSTIKF